MRLPLFFAAIFTLLAFVPAFAAEDLAEMNGIRLKDYPDFQHTWKQVTVRFRTDTGEQRFTYANDMAWKALLADSKDYPDGAVFAKIGIMTEEDPEFTSSKVPAGATRIQFMVRDKKKYASTSGWGYAVFNPAGTRLNPEPPDEQAKACDACHLLVQQSRGEVFSQPMRLLELEGVSMKDGGSSKLSFSDHRTDTLPEEVKKILPVGVTSIRFLESPVRNEVFNGTLNEIRPALIHEAVHARRPALLLSKDGKRFCLIIKLDNGPGSCPPGQKQFISYYTIVNKAPNVAEQRTVAREFFCEKAD